MADSHIFENLNIHRIAVAARDVSCAKDGFEAIHRLNAAPGDNLFQTLLFGAVTSYCRPFTNNDGFQNISGKWRKFPSDTKFTLTHHTLIEYRNNVAAHSSINNNSLHIYPPGVTLTIGSHSETTTQPFYSVATPLLGFDVIDSAIQLCEFQHQRMLEFIIPIIDYKFNNNKHGENPFIFNHKEH